jgi:hypothetical protein
MGRQRAAEIGAFAETGLSRSQTDDFAGAFNDDVVPLMFNVASDRAEAMMRAPTGDLGSKGYVVALSLRFEAATAAPSGIAYAMFVTILGNEPRTLAAVAHAERSAHAA